MWNEYPETFKILIKSCRLNRILVRGTNIYKFLTTFDLKMIKDYIRAI